VNYKFEEMMGGMNSFLGLGYVNSDLAGVSPGQRLRAIWFPHWFCVLLFSILPSLQVRKMLRTRRDHRSGCCNTCGYDLRATPNQCPECGAARAAE
jgi:hypothetical protein